MSRFVRYIAAFVGVSADNMDCGPAVPLCGVLALESGYGSGFYHHQAPTVHGLWPEVRPYGSSQCIAPAEAAPPSQVHRCYDSSDDDDHILWFERHEWSKHGVCAGAHDESDFFGQVCGLSAEPLRVMAAAEAVGSKLAGVVAALRSSGHAVWKIDAVHSQVYLSACAGADGRWVLAEVEAFPRVCGGGSNSSSTMAPAPKTPQCMSGKHGPRCSSKGECANLSGCVRCAHSGFCTDVPLSRSLSFSV